jgi:hypothetical protein
VNDVEKMNEKEKAEYFSEKVKGYKVLLDSKIRELEYETLKDKNSIRVYVLKSEIVEVKKLIEDVEKYVSSLDEKKKVAR